DYYSRVSQLQDQLTVLQGQLSSAVSSRDTLRQQLAAVNPGLAVPLLPDSTRAASLQPILDIDQRIALQRKQLDDLLQRYTEDYPDVITTRQTIARLEREKRKQAKMPKTTADSADALQSAAATNPVYQQLRVTLAQADANVASLQAQVRDLQSRLSQLRAQATQMPKFDEQYNQLNRDYNSVNENYQKLVQRRESAILSRDQDNSRKHSLFRIIDPPRLSPSALFPRRTFLLAFLLVCALGFGTLTTYLLVLLPPTFHNLRELRESTGRPALGAISLTLTPAETDVEHRNQNLFMLASGLLVIGLVTLTVLNILKPIH
ncbi:MAG: hypothetical protein KGJ55_11470, partial [Gammaproteobacteria bacterium]|nr:hypothetical protein [Gammaproteobacteria bacterium]